MYRIYYMKNNYMFRHCTLAIFRLRNERNVVSSYTRLMRVVYCIQYTLYCIQYTVYCIQYTVYSIQYIVTNPHKSSIAAY